MSWQCFSLIFFLLLVFFNSQVNSAAVKVKPISSKEKNATLIEYLEQEKIYLTIAINNAKEYLSPKDEKEFNTKLNQTSAMLTVTVAKTQVLEGFLDNQNKQHINFNQRLKHLQQLPLANAEITIQERVGKVEALLITSNKTIELINENLALAKQLQILLNDELKKLSLWKENFELEQKLVQINLTKNKLNHELSTIYQNNIVIRKSNKHSASSSNVQVEFEAGILINNQRISLLHYQLTALNLQKNTVKADISLLNNFDTKTLQLVTDTYKDSVNQYSNLERSLKKMLDSLGKELSLLVSADLNKSFDLLQISLKEQIKVISSQKQSLLKNLDNYQSQLRKLISSRQSLAEYNMNSWPIIINKLIDIPHLFYKYVKILTLKIYDSYTWLNIISTTILWIVLGLIVVVFIILNRFLKTLISDKERSSLTGYLYDGALVLVQRNLPYLCLFFILRSVLYFTNISFSNYQLLVNIITVWFTFRILILIARLGLLERISDSSGKDVKLYYRLKWLLLFGGWTTALMVFSHILPLSLLLQDIFNRLFMLFILAVSLVAWKSKDVIRYLLKPLLMTKKKYYKHVFSLLVVLVPITLFTTAVIGLLGFVNLAWTMSRYQAYTLLVLVGYILARGLVFDALELFSEWMISSLKNGWLWIEVFLKPIDKILRVVLFLVSTLTLFQVRNRIFPGPRAH